MFKKTLAAFALMLVTLCGSLNAKAADDTIKVGILHSLSGTMAISETTLKDVMLMLIDEQNKKGGRPGPGWAGACGQPVRRAGGCTAWQPYLSAR